LAYFFSVCVYSFHQLYCANEGALTVYKRPYPRLCHSSGYGIQKVTLAVAGHVFFQRESRWASKSPRRSWPERENAESRVFAASHFNLTHFNVYEANLTSIQRANVPLAGYAVSPNGVYIYIYNCTV